MKNKYGREHGGEKINESEVPSLNYDVIKDGVDPRMEALWEETRIQDEKVAQDMKDMEYEQKLYADGFRKIEISVNGEACTTIWGLRSDDPLKDDYLELRTNGEVERFEVVAAEYLPTYESL
tara:strand:- start:94 stop:459 length:366 start_codon:yes stop_codon:yes gene_type:complete